MARKEVEEWFYSLGGDLPGESACLGTVRPRLANGRCWEPRLDLMEEERQFILRAELAGVRGEDIQLHYTPERHALLLRGHRAEPISNPDSHVGFYQLEIYYGEFMREIKLPDVSIDPDGIRAQYRNGFLVVVIPKRERTQSIRVVSE
ncbi:MAG: Hsp20/alpha crystallin family protein [Fimbriimonas sp.]